MPYFKEYHTYELRRIFTELADFLHKHELTQIVGAGPSAYHYAHALERAYKKRYGTNARKLCVVNLGALAEHEVLGRSGRRASGEEVRAFLVRRRKLDLTRKSLVLDDVSRTGQTINTLSNSLRAAGLPHKTAVLASVSLMKSSFWPAPDYVGSTDIPMNRVHVERGRRLASKRLARQWAATMREIQLELREVANGVEEKK